ncbi:MAG: addiction module protein [Verrucomicrobiota bacterium]
MTVQEVKILPTEEKFQIMEAIWEDLREWFETSEISPQLRDLLRDRRARVTGGEARLLDWDSAKFAIGRG